MKRSELILFARSDIPFYLAIVHMPIDLKNTKISFMGKHGHKDAQLYYFNARWYDAETGRFITEDPARDGLLWYAYANNNPLKFTDPTGLRPIKEDPKTDERENKETHKAEERENRRNNLNEVKDKIIESGKKADHLMEKINGLIDDVEDEIIDDLSLFSYDAIPESVDEILNGRLAEKVETYVESKYHRGGELASTEGGPGLDCSSTVQNAAEYVSGKSIADRTVDEMLKDPKLLKDGNGQIGSMNLYDWKATAGGPFDHITTLTEHGEVHPSEKSGTIRYVNPGGLDYAAESKVNKVFNWRYLLWE